ncbi:MAG: hypothetical protein M0P95_17790 [Sulfuritalea sp.]|jgi:hypothetical protein|nr:hypothetical protein [Sulfuritalea sp.]
MSDFFIVAGKEFQVVCDVDQDGVITIHTLLQSPWAVRTAISTIRLLALTTAAPLQTLDGDTPQSTRLAEMAGFKRTDKQVFWEGRHRNIWRM